MGATTAGTCRRLLTLLMQPLDSFADPCKVTQVQAAVVFVDETASADFDHLEEQAILRATEAHL